MRLLLLLTILLAGNVFAEEYTYKDWMWSPHGDGYAWAGTGNDAGRFLGIACYYESGNCVYLVSLGLNCNESSEYPSLVSTDKGVEVVTLVCTGIEGAFAIMPYDTVDNLIRQASRLRMAVAVDNEQFKVVSFSLAGSTAAVKEMQQFFTIMMDDFSGKSSSAPAAAEQLL
jgi:hypothetical protein